MNELFVDLSDDQSFTHGFPHDFFTWLRKNEPIYWHEPTEITPDGEGFWVISRYADVNAIIMDPTRFSSDKAGHRTGIAHEQIGLCCGDCAVWRCGFDGVFGGWGQGEAQVRKAGPHSLRVIAVGKPRHPGLAGSQSCHK